MTRAGVALVAALVVAGCGEADAPKLAGDADNGRLLLRQFGCGTCHRIPGVAAARGNVGPPLDAIGSRAYVAGELPNTPDNLVHWIMDPKSVHPRTAMPDMAVSEAQARDIVAYLWQLR